MVFNIPIETKEQAEDRAAKLREAAVKHVTEKVNPLLIEQGMHAAGGMTGMRDMMAWVDANLTPDEAEEFNAAVDDPSRMQSAIANMRHRMALAAPGEAFAACAAAGGCKDEAEVREYMDIVRKRAPASKVGEAHAKIARTPQALIDIGLGNRDAFGSDGSGTGPLNIQPGRESGRTIQR